MFSNSLTSTIYEVSAHHRHDLAQHAVGERMARACNGGNGPQRRTRLLRLVMALSPALTRRRELHSAVT